MSDSRRVRTFVSLFYFLSWGVVSLVFLSLLACESNAVIIIPGGCDACVSFEGVKTKEESLKILENSRCAVEPGGTKGVCLNCRLDEHCRSDSAPTRKCTTDHRCICGSDKDCSDGQFCLGGEGCVQCTKHEHCEGLPKPFCIYNRCEGSCEPGSKQPCTQDGVCSAFQECTNAGVWGKCQSAGGKPEKELCDERDNDCDGLVDEDFPQLKKSCNENIGPCKVSGVWQCKADFSGVLCKGEPQGSKQEDCNGVDDDCDGVIDNNISAPLCTKQEGVCKGARKTCGGEKGWIDCDDAAYKKHAAAYDKVFDGQNAATCDGLDNNCNGQIDEAPTEQAEACSNPTAGGVFGECKNGRTACEKQKTVCLPGQPTTEICDDKDNDCDGQVDEDFTKKGQVCTAGQGDCQTTDKFVCNDSKDGTVCAAKERTKQPETCNKIDDDCNGMVDDIQAKSCQVVGTKGACATGQQQCIDGKLTCFQINQPSPELADQRDNDCDGYVDEGIVSLVLSTKSLLGESNVNITGIAINSKQEVFFSSNSTQCIYKLDPTTKQVVVYAGKASEKGNVDSLTNPLNARFRNPGKLTFDLSGTHLFVSDRNNHSIRRIDGVTGSVSTYTTGFKEPGDLAFAKNGTLYVVNETELYQVSTSGTATLIPVANSTMRVRMFGLTIDSMDRLYRLQRVDGCSAKGSCSCFGTDCLALHSAKMTPNLLGLDGACTAVCSPSSPGVDYESLQSSGEKIFGVFEGEQIFMLADVGLPKKLLIAGNGKASPVNDILATKSGFNNISQMAFDKKGNLYIADYGNDQIRVIKGPVW
ncbi:MAG: hypothetical protein CL920_25735 [Deltaproteobacteria bacterium]|nr:hypothetical protein [Deltaproteobacteria bacterium]MBU52109.1 hypothetical protein [Deltaproteobacteria bacterium]